MKTLFAFLFSFTALSIHAQQAGIPDSSFGVDGKVMTTFDGDVVSCYDAALQTDGKLITVGEGSISQEGVSIAGFLLVRYDKNGLVDTSFGDKGRIITDFQYSYVVARAIAIQNDEKFVVAGYGKKGIGLDEYYDILIARYLKNGTLDSSFGNNGKIITQFGKDARCYDVTIDQYKRVLITGDVGVSFLTSRYNENGTKDISFGLTGNVVTDFTGIASSKTISLQQDGKIVTAGVVGNSAAVTRYFSDGEIDSGFGKSGFLITSFGYSFASINSAILNKEGKLIIAGNAGSGFNGNMLVAQLNSNGSFDESFGSKGIVTIKYDNVSSGASTVILQKDSKLIITGSTYKGFTGDENSFAIARLLPDGTRDSLFGNNGLTTTDFGIYYGESVWKGLLTEDGKIIAAGSSTNFNPPSERLILLARYIGDTEKQPLYVRIKHWLHKHGFTWEDWPGKNNITSYTIERSSNGNSFTAIGQLFRNSSGQYHFEDIAPLAGNNYYRVAAASSSGVVTYSNVLAIPNNDAVIVYPNPAQNSISITGLSASEKTSLRITDLNGNTKASTTITAGSYNWNISSLPKGNYVLQVVSGGNVVTKKIVKE